MIKVVIGAGMFVLLGILFFKGKCLFLVAGYNTATKEAKDRVDERKLGKYMGCLCLPLQAAWDCHMQETL